MSIPQLVQDLARHAPEFRRALRNHKWEATDDGGILFSEQKAIARGYFTISQNGGPDELSPNMLVTEGLNKMLGVHYNSDTQIPAWYLGLFTGNVSVAASWTAANFAANATENTSTSEGYTNATRPAFTPFAAPSAGQLSNMDGSGNGKVVFTFATAGSVTVRGCALLSTSTRGGTTGVLNSASRLPADKTLTNGETLSVGYTLALTSS
jgi:hypothetical protein